MNKIVLAAYCVIERDGNILLVKGIDQDGKVTRWTLPGGKMEDGELMTEGVFREVKEEVGLEVELAGFIYIDEYKAPPGPGRIRLFFTGSAEGEFRLQEAEIDEAKWLSPDEAKELNAEDFHLPPYFEAVKRYLAGEVYPKDIFRTVKKS